MTSLHHISFTCADPTSMEAFYCERFGFRRCRVFKAGELGQFVILRLGATCVELHPLPDGSKPAERADGAAPRGFRHLAFSVGDLDGFIADLKRHGIEVGDVKDCSTQAEGLRVAFLQDPEGNYVEIMEGWTDDPNPPLD